ncbi:DUF6542 domain-containing protein [Nocardia bovistercoris]|uniref:DUF6542 domain-containing protein n=1 Tax=Nocardia bovistercoris TaxID=2785916 RepID=A0A931I934_9NOCA|nr:DUF6542 domain-containing protein [Nocardia bovistercoris]MBH0775982.1 hypothetical protein [Nocardia bovistercoris]
MAASQRVRSRTPAPQRSILPSVPGIPAGAAVLIAVASTFLGFLIDAKSEGGDLTGTFAALYVAGCVAAVSAVRYRGLFTTMVLPPLLLFIAVPLAYQQLTGRASTSGKDILLNLAIPLVDRFPTMMLATALVLVIGGLRIHLHRRAEAQERGDEAKRGTSWGRDSSADRPRKGSVKSKSKGKPAKATRSPDAPLKRRPRQPKPTPEPVVDISDQKTDKYEPPRPGGRRPSDEVADKPPRVAAKGRPREGRPAARNGRPPAAAARGQNNAAPSAQNDAAPRGQNAAAPRGQSKAAPSAQNNTAPRGQNNATARAQNKPVPRAENEPQRGGRGRGEAPPHPRPNVRYRDPQRAERRKPEKR